MIEQMFCIHNKKASGCVGNCVLLWRPDGCGYTVNLDEAWKVTQQQADDICRSRPKEDFAVSYELLASLSHRHIDIGAMRSALKAKPAAPATEAASAAEEAKPKDSGAASTSLEVKPK